MAFMMPSIIGVEKITIIISFVIIRDKCSIKKAAFFCLSGFVIILNVVGACMQLNFITKKQ